MEPPNSPLPPDVIAARPLRAARVRPLDLSTMPRRDAALDLGLALLLTLVSPLMLTVAIGADVPGFTADMGGLLVIGKWFDALLIIALLAYLLYRHRLPPEALGLQLTRPLRQVAWAIPTFVAIYVAMAPMVLTILVLVMFFPGLVADLQQRVEFISVLPRKPGQLVPLLAAVSIHEELLFRVLLVPYLRRLMGSWTLAVLTSSALFAILHLSQGWLGALQVFSVGAMLGLFFVLSRSALAVMLAHFGFNGLQLLLFQAVAPQWLERIAPSGS